MHTIHFLLFVLSIGLVQTDNGYYPPYDVEEDRRTLGRQQYSIQGIQSSPREADIVKTAEACEGTWSDWKPIEGVVCSSLCGTCGVIDSERTCQPPGCQCQGESTGLQSCNYHPCYTATFLGCD